MLFGTSLNSTQEESCLVSEEVAQDEISCMVQLLPSSFSKREEGEEKVTSCLQEAKFVFTVCIDKELKEKVLNLGVPEAVLRC
jgi:hypothetical protein